MKQENIIRLIGLAILILTISLIVIFDHPKQDVLVSCEERFIADNGTLKIIDNGCSGYALKSYTKVYSNYSNESKDWKVECSDYCNITKEINQ